MRWGKTHTQAEREYEVNNDKQCTAKGQKGNNSNTKKILFFLNIFLCRETQTDGQTDRQRQRQRDRERHTQRDRESETQSDRDRVRQRERQRQRDRDREEKARVRCVE